MRAQEDLASFQHWWQQLLVQSEPYWRTTPVIFQGFNSPRNTSSLFETFARRMLHRQGCDNMALVWLVRIQLNGPLKVVKLGRSTAFHKHPSRPGCLIQGPPTPEAATSYGALLSV